MADSVIEIINDTDAFTETLYEQAGPVLGDEVMRRLSIWSETYHNREERVLLVLSNKPVYLNGVTPPFPFLVVCAISRPADMRKSRTLFGLVLNLAEKSLANSRVKDQYN